MCADHVMSSVGDTSGYSVTWMSPAQTFPTVTEVDFDVNLTDLGTRQWWKVGVVSEAKYNTVYHGACCYAAPGFLASDVGASDLPGSLATTSVLYATWSGGASAGYPGGHMKIGNTNVGAATGSIGANDKATRYAVSLKDNPNNTLTFTVAGQSATINGTFPTCPCRVILTGHAYRPDKDGIPVGHTWHWDNIIVK